MIWLFIGIGLCLLEAVFPTAFVALVAGVSALLVALIPGWVPPSLQIILWMLLTAIGIFASRGFVDRRAAQQFDAKEGQMLTDLAPGELGRVRYEGGSWAARCEDPTLAIDAEAKVLVVGREGTTLLVLPESDPRR
jgi:membrane protein implicated in regulation of membrane protease activity